MVKVVFAGGAGHIAREIVDVLVAEKKHEVVVFSRGDVSKLAEEGISAVQVDYTKKTALVEQLKGTHTVLSFIAAHMDPESISQRTLIDACVEAGVKRFAPSEWATHSNSGVSWYAGKDQVRKYLEDLNRDRKVLEYCLFQPGGFTELLTYPYQTTKHCPISPLHIDIENKRALVLDDGQGQVTLTTINDFVKVVVAALDYSGEWPVVGGINGGNISIAKLIEVAGKIRGQPFATEKVHREDILAGTLKTSWAPDFKYPGVPEEQRAAFGAMVTMGTLVSFEDGAWKVSDEWNKLLPDMKFTGPEEFLETVWTGKP